MTRRFVFATLIAAIVLPIQPGWGACPPKIKSPCLNPTVVKGPRTGPIILPTADQFATAAEYQAALAEYRRRSESDLKAGFITRKTYNAEMNMAKNAPTMMKQR